MGDVLLESSTDCYARSDGMLTAVVGLRDAIVVTTQDAVLAMHRDRAQDVKKIVERLRAAGRRPKPHPTAVATGRGASTRA